MSVIKGPLQGPLNFMLVAFTNISHINLTLIIFYFIEQKQMSMLKIEVMHRCAVIFLKTLMILKFQIDIRVDCVCLRRGVA